MDDFPKLGGKRRKTACCKSGRATRRSAPLKDDTALARVLALLGQSRLSSDLNQLAKVVHIGALPVTPEIESEIVAACAAVSAMRGDLLAALGLPEGGHR